MAARERQRDKQQGLATRRLSWPTAVLGGGILLSLAANLAQAQPTAWGRIVATVACIAWSATCIGLPVAVLVLNSLWRRKPPPAQAARPLF